LTVECFIAERPFKEFEDADKFCQYVAAVLSSYQIRIGIDVMTTIAWHSRNDSDDIKSEFVWRCFVTVHNPEIVTLLLLRTDLFKLRDTSPY